MFATAITGTREGCAWDKRPDCAEGLLTATAKASDGLVVAWMQFKSQTALSECACARAGHPCEVQGAAFQAIGCASI
jgi:hypothetical protein